MMGEGRGAESMGTGRDHSHMISMVDMEIGVPYKQMIVLINREVWQGRGGNFADIAHELSVGRDVVIPLHNLHFKQNIRHSTDKLSRKRIPAKMKVCQYFPWGLLPCFLSVSSQFQIVPLLRDSKW